MSDATIQLRAGDRVPLVLFAAWVGIGDWHFLNDKTTTTTGLGLAVCYAELVVFDEKHFRPVWDEFAVGSTVCFFIVAITSGVLVQRRVEPTEFVMVRKVLAVVAGIIAGMSAMFIEAFQQGRSCLAHRSSPVSSKRFLGYFR